MMQHSEWMMNEINRQMNNAMCTQLQATIAHTQTNKNETQLSKDLILSIEASMNAHMSSGRTSYAVVAMSKIQVRKHKKRRINKKWAKRYGYKNSCPLKFGECVVIGDKMYMSQETFDVVRKSIPKGCSIHYNNTGGQIEYGR